MNGFPVEVPASWKSPFFELYHDFSVVPEAVPFVVVAITCGPNLACYEQKISLDMRQISIAG